MTSRVRISQTSSRSCLFAASVRKGLAQAALAGFFVASICISARAQQAATPTPEQASRAQAIGKRMKCMCGGCDDAAGMCTHSGGAFAGPCDVAKGELKEASDRAARGESDDLIAQDFVQEYGPTVLIEPPKHGFNWLAWVMPVLVPIIAILVVYGLAQRWRERAALAPAGGVPIDPGLLARAHRESGDSDE